MGIFSSKKPVSVAAPDVDPNDAPTLAAESRKTQKEFDRAIWWVEHRDAVKRVGIGVLIALEILVGLIGLWQFVDYYVFDYVEEQRLIDSLLASPEQLYTLAREQAPLDIVVAPPVVLASGSGYDVLSFATNENEGWVARLTYHMRLGDVPQKTEQVILLQGEKAPLVLFEVEGARPRNPDIVVENVEWYRIDTTRIPFPVQWKEERLHVEAQNVEHDDQFRIGSKTFGRTTFSLANKSGYGYYEMDVFVVLRRGGAPVAVNRTVVSDVLPREVRPIQINWFDTTPRATDVEMFPRVNLFDPSVYRPESVEASVDVRDTLLERR